MSQPNWINPHLNRPGAHPAYQIRSIYVSKTGNQTVTPIPTRFYVPQDGTIVAVHASVGTAPATNPVIVDVNKNGTTIHTDQGTRATIAAATNAGVSTTAAVSALVAGDYLTVDVDAIGSGTAGADLVVRIDYRVTD